jgi:hypothetical protein
VFVSAREISIKEILNEISCFDSPPIMSSKTLPNGSAEAPIEVSSLPPVVGINFGKTYGVYEGQKNFVLQIKRFMILAANQEGLAECIANEDGERQITYAIAFQVKKSCVNALSLASDMLITCIVHRKSSKKPVG